MALLVSVPGVVRTGRRSKAATALGQGGTAATGGGCCLLNGHSRLAHNPELAPDLAGNRPEVRTLEGHSGTVNGVRVSPDGRRAVSASSDRTLRVWDLELIAAVATYTCDASAQCCTFAGSHGIVAGDYAGRVHFLELIEKN
jgi:WD40 repeat protein